MQIVENVFSEELIAELQRFSRDGKQPSYTNFFSWGESVIQSSNAIFKFHINGDLKTSIANELIAKGLIQKEPKVWTAAIQIYSRNSYIPWHADTNYSFSATVYLNKIWDRDFGGYFLYDDSDVVKAVIPKYNVGLFYSPPLEHAVSLTATHAPFRESLQIFVSEL
jgi:hypothetical protein